jgi:hypothetical protein
MVYQPTQKEVMVLAYIRQHGTQDIHSLRAAGLKCSKDYLYKCLSALTREGLLLATDLPRADGSPGPRQWTAVAGDPVPLQVRARYGRPPGKPEQMPEQEIQHRRGDLPQSIADRAGLNGLGAMMAQQIGATK